MKTTKIQHTFKSGNLTAVVRFDAETETKVLIEWKKDGKPVEGWNTKLEYFLNEIKNGAMQSYLKNKQLWSY